MGPRGLADDAGNVILRIGTLCQHRNLIASRLPFHQQPMA